MKKTRNKEELFETYPIPKAVAALTLPTVAACLVMVVYNLADTFFVGALNDAAATSAVTLAAPVLLAFNAVNNLFGVGCASMMSRSLGAKDYDTAKKAAAFGIYGAVLSGVLFSAAAAILHDPLLKLLGADEITTEATYDYLFWTVICGAVPSILNVVMGNMVRAEGCSVHASVGTMSGCLLNVILDPLFIMPDGLGMGAAGAGCATFLSNCAACLYFFIFIIVKRGRTYVSISPKDLRPTKKLVKGVLAVGIPASVQNLLNVTGMTVLNNFTAAFGAEAVSAMGIDHKIAMVPLYVAMGFGQGIMPLVGYNYASGNRKRMRDSVLFTIAISGGIMILSTVLMYRSTAPIVRMFMENEQVVEYGARFLKGFVLAQPFLCLDFLAVGVFQACGLGLRSLIFALARKIVLEIPALFILNRLFPLYGLAYAQLCAEVVLAIAAVCCLVALFKNNQKKKPGREGKPI